MTSLGNFSSHVLPVPIPPVLPNFLFCSGDYGTHLRRSDAFLAGSLLPQGIRPVTYSVDAPDIDDLAANVSVPEPGYHLPFLELFGGVAISVDVAGAIKIDEFRVAPNDIRGMAGYVAKECVGRQGKGGFITRSIQGLVDYVTDPTSDVEAPLYPDNTAFLTVTVSNQNALNPFPGDYDPQMARFLWKTERAAADREDPRERYIIAGRIKLFARAEVRMRRMGTEVPWWGGWEMQGNRTAVSNLQLSNVTTESATTARRSKRGPGLFRGGSSVPG